MKVIAADVSDYQSGADWGALAVQADGIWVKWADWSWWSRYGSGENLHASIIAIAQSVGKPAGSYLFARPGWTSAEYQIDTWADNCPPLTMSSMLDLESPGYLSGQELTDWVNAALARMWVRFGRIPVLYWSARFASENGMGQITVPHIDMVAEYHRGYQPFFYAEREGWEAYAYAAYGGPDLPWGEARIDVWQFTSSARFPAYDGSLDCSFITDEAFVLAVGGDPVVIPPASQTIEEALMADERFDTLMQIVSSLPDLIDGQGGGGGVPVGHYRPAPLGTPTEETEGLYAGLYQGRPPIVFDWALNNEVTTKCVAFDFTFLPPGATIYLHPIETGEAGDPTSGFWTGLVNAWTQVFAATWWGQFAQYTTTQGGFHTIVHPANRPIRVEISLDGGHSLSAPAPVPNRVVALRPPPRHLMALSKATPTVSEPDAAVVLQTLVGGLDDLAEQVKFALAKHPGGVDGIHAADIIQTAVDRAIGNAASRAMTTS